MKINYPVNITDADEKTAFLYRLQEKLRLDHNIHGNDFKDEKITEEEWNSYLDVWNEKSDAVIKEILAQRSTLKNDASWNININTAFTE